MSPTHSPAGQTTQRFQLTVRTGDAQTEIVVLDARGRFVQRGFGPERMFDLERGIYRIKALTGAEVQEKSVVLTEQPGVTVQFAADAFTSPVPLLGTSTSHEYHVAAAATESRRTHVADGVGSSLFFLVRDWTPAAVYGAPSRVTGNPAEGLFLYVVTQGEERKICDLAAAGESSLTGDPWSACTIDVAPGVYELRLQLPGGETLHQSFMASPGWQTQAFVFMRGYPGGPGTPAKTEWRADLSRTSVLLSPNKGFSPEEPMLRIAELARVALAIKRPGERGGPERRLLPDQLRTLLREKWSNPMLGIYGGHLLLMETTVDGALFRDVVRNLRLILGAPHPDVEALALRAEGESSPRPFEDAPMLRRSWSLIVDASVDQPGLVTDSLARRHTGDSWSEGPWHIWRSSVAVDLEDEPEGLALSGAEAALAEDLGVMKLVRRLKREQSTGGSADIVRGAPHPSTRTVFESTTVPGDDESLESDLETVRVAERLPVARSEVTVEIDDDQLRSIARRFGLPGTQVKQLLNTLEDKMGRTAEAPNLKVVLKTLFK